MLRRILIVAVIITLNNFFFFLDASSPVDCSRATNAIELRECLTTPCSALVPANETYLQNGCYNRNMPPALNTSVIFVAHPFLLKDVDERGQRVRLELMILTAWHDARLVAPAGSESLYQDPQTSQPSMLCFDNHRIWHPPIALTSGMHDTLYNNNGGNLPWLEPFVRSSHSMADTSGTVFESVHYVDWTYCAFSSRHYPFERSTCHISILSQDFAAKLRLPPLSPTTGVPVQSKECFELISTTNYSIWAGMTSEARIECFLSLNEFVYIFLPTMHSIWRTGEWQLLKDEQKSKQILQWKNSSSLSTMKNKTQLPMLTATFVLARSSQQQVVMWIVVPGALSPMASLTIVTVCDRSERFGFGSSIILALTLMQVSLMDKLMPSDEGVPIITWYFMLLVDLVAVACVAASLLEAYEDSKKCYFSLKLKKNDSAQKKKKCLDSTKKARNWLVVAVVVTYFVVFTVCGAHWYFRL